MIMCKRCSVIKTLNFENLLKLMGLTLTEANYQTEDKLLWA